MPLSHWMLLVFFSLSTLVGPAASAYAQSRSSDRTAGGNPQAIAGKLDRVLADELNLDTAGADVAEKVDDEAFLRRVFLDTVGRLPTPNDLLAFQLDDRPDKRNAVVKQLLADEQFGENWGKYWRDVIFYRRSEDRSLLASPATEEFLTEQLNRNVPWDEIATEFIIAAGNAREDGRNGLIAAHAGRPEETVAEISRIFLGIQIQCAQCHDHPTDRWKREQFHQLAAFFPRVASRPNGQGAERTILVTAQDRFPRIRTRGNNNNRFRGTAEHYMPDLEEPTARGTRMQPVFFLSEDALEFGANDETRRGSLADWLTDADNEWFAKAYVNRIWSELVGEGFYHFVDDIGPDRTAHAPATLDYLSTQFAEHGYDTKWLFEVIMSTDAYQRTSRARRGYGETPYLANCAQPLRGDQLYNALVSALGLPENRQTGAGEGAYARFRDPRFGFNEVFGYDPSEPREDVGGSIPRALAMMNSTFIETAISAGNGSLKRLLRTVDDDRTVISELYVNTLGREPTAKERAICLRYLRQVGEREEAFEDIQWSLLNSTEFLYRD